MKVKLLSRARLLATPWTGTIHGIFQARVLEWGAIAFSELATETGLMLTYKESSVGYYSESLFLLKLSRNDETVAI